MHEDPEAAVDVWTLIASPTRVVGRSFAQPAE
jgi:hypothetical protein